MIKDKSLVTLIEEKDAAGIAEYMREYDLIIRDGKIVPRDEASKKKLTDLSKFYDGRQQARKILLNSLYGALLNEAMRFYSEAMGQSVTLTGRSIVRHMNSQINKEVTGEYDHLGAACIYADTDSAYFSVAPMMNADCTRDDYIKIYDTIADNVNNTFPRFMADSFNTSLERGAIIQAGRELVASKMLFIKKKKYGGLIYDKEGSRKDKGNSPGELKVMGLDLKRADTPKYMQGFLENVLTDVLLGAGEKEIIQQIRDFRLAFRDRPAWEKGSPKKVSNLTKYRRVLERSASMGISDVRRKDEKGKNSVPGHVRASLHWNHLCSVHNDLFSMRITDGSRIIVCKLKPNLLKIDSIAYPIDEPHLPQWFKDLPFDDAAMENVIVDKKVSNLLEVMKWSLKDSHITDGEEFFTFG